MDKVEDEPANAWDRVVAERFTAVMDRLWDSGAV